MATGATDCERRDVGLRVLVFFVVAVRLAVFPVFAALTFLTLCERRDVGLRVLAFFVVAVRLAVFPVFAALTFLTLSVLVRLAFVGVV